LSGSSKKLKTKSIKLISPQPKLDWGPYGPLFVSRPLNVDFCCENVESDLSA